MSTSQTNNQSQSLVQIQDQVEAIKLQSTREILKQFQALKTQTLIKDKTGGGGSKLNSSSSTNQTNPHTSSNISSSKISKQEEQLKTKLWKLWIDQTQENKLKSEALTSLVIYIKSKSNDLVLALRSLSTNPNTLAILQFLIENKMAKINGYVEVSDQEIFYTNPSGQSIPIGNMELTEIEIEKQKLYTHHFKSVKKICEITLVELETMPKMEGQKAEIFLQELVGKIGG